LERQELQSEILETFESDILPPTPQPGFSSACSTNHNTGGRASSGNHCISLPGPNVITLQPNLARRPEFDTYALTQQMSFQFPRELHLYQRYIVFVKILTAYPIMLDAEAYV